MSTIKYYYKFIIHILFLNLFTKFDTNNVFFPNLPQFENIVVLELYHIYIYISISSEKTTNEIFFICYFRKFGEITYRKVTKSDVPNLKLS